MPTLSPSHEKPVDKYLLTYPPQVVVVGDGLLSGGEETRLCCCVPLGEEEDGVDGVVGLLD